MSKTKIIAFANNKGGSGKTTSCSNIGYALSALGKKVLLIDGDMQLNLTLSYFDEERAIEYASGGKNIYTAIKEEKDLSDFVVATEYDGCTDRPDQTDIDREHTFPQQQDQNADKSRRDGTPTNRLDFFFV